METDCTVDRPERFTFHKGERLRHRTLVEGLYSKGKSIYEFPLRMSWRILSPEELESSFRDGVPSPIDCLQMMVTVPKRKRKHAVDRVAMRRRIREAYRLHRLPLKRLAEENPSIRTLCLSFVYIHDRNLPYSSIEPKMKNLMGKLIRKIESRRSDASPALVE